MKLSIITINYNNCNGLADTIRSVEAQTLKDFEWIVVDGGSTDGSRDLIEAHADSFSYWVSEPDNGIYHAMNKGIKEAGGEYLLFLNSGDMLADNQVVEHVVPSLHDFDFVVGNIYKSDNLGVKAFDENNLSFQRLPFMLTISSLPHQSTFIRKSVFERCGFYREDLKIVSDWVLVVKALVFNQCTLKSIPTVVSIYDVKGISSVNKKLYNDERAKVIDEWKCFKSYFLFYRDYFEMATAIDNNRVARFFNRFFFFLKRR